MPVPYHSVFTGRMPFLPPNQQHQSTEGINSIDNQLIYICPICWVQTSPHSMADKHLKMLFISRHGISTPGTGGIRQLDKYDQLVDMLESIVIHHNSHIMVIHAGQPVLAGTPS